MDVDITVVHGLWTPKYLLTSINFSICVLCNEIKGVHGTKILRTPRLQKEEH